MNIRIKRKQTVEEIALMGVSLGVAIIFLGLSYVFPFSSLLMMLFIPILTSLVALKVKFGHQLLFMVGITIVSFIDIQEGFFYLWPNALIGLAFGNLIKYKIDAGISYIVTSFLAGLLNSLTYFPILWLFKVDMISIYSTLLALPRNDFLVFYPSFCLILAEVEMFFVILIASEEIKKFGYSLSVKLESDIYLLLATLFSMVGAITWSYNPNMFSLVLIILSLIPVGLVVLELFVKIKNNSLKTGLIIGLPILSIALLLISLSFSISNFGIGFVLGLIPYIAILMAMETRDKQIVISRNIL